MKKNIKGSILMWSMFLLLFISFSFIYISMGIKTKINQQYDIVSNIGNLNHQNTSTGYLYTLNNSEIYKKQFQDSFKSSLGVGEKDRFVLKTEQKITFILKSGILKFTGNGNYSIVKTNQELPGGQYSTGTYFIESLTGYSEYEIIFEDGNNIKYPYNFTEIYKRVSGKNFLKTTYLTK